MDPDIEAAMKSLTLTRRPAEAAFEAGKYDEAKQMYFEYATMVVGSDFEIPLAGGISEGGVRCSMYTKMGHLKKVYLMGCCNGIAQCLILMNDIEGALEWLEEVRILGENIRFALEEPLFDWINYHLDIPELSLQRIMAHSAAADIFLSLGNTGNSVHLRWSSHFASMPSHHQTARVMKLVDMRKIYEIIQLRHPDPYLTPKVEVKELGLQVLGSWQKLKIGKMGGMTSRLSFTSFIWNSHIYVAGGRKDSRGPFYRDLWSLDLNTLDTWRPLPPYPIPFTTTGAFLGWHMIPHPSHNKAYLFTGQPQLDFFDLSTQKWGSITTTYKRADGDTQAGLGSWPYPNRHLTDSTQQIVHGKLYVFGGTHGTTSIGCNLYMELDLDSRKWKRLSGTVMPITADSSCPGPRKTPSSWVDKARERIYLVFGECDREGAEYSGEPHGADCGYPYGDFWSWNIKEGKWRRERVVGNPPCPRSEAACTYNPVLDKTIIWGGYNPALPTVYPLNKEQFRFSYFADTFIYDTSPSSTSSSIKSPKWKQVLTRGFPTYRAQSQLLSDPATGKTYLFGGYTNTDYVPSRKNYISRSFRDLWQLRIDMPGGYFDGVNLEEEARTAEAGPWQRCFSCGCAGPWKKCGGSCRGRAFFCDPQCLKDGWKEHKEMHNCRKVA